MCYLVQLSYFGWVQPEQPTRIGFEFPGELPYAPTEPEPDLAQDVPEDSAEMKEQALDLLGGPTAAELFRERLSRQGIINLDGFSGSPPEDTVVWGDELGMILRAEQLLDEHTTPGKSLSGSRRRHLDFVLQSTQASLEGVGEPSEVWQLLAASALLRADHAGCVETLPASSTKWGRWIAEDARGEGFLSGRAWQALYEHADRESTGD